MTDVITKGNRAKALLEDETLKEAFASVRKAILDGFENTHPEDSDMLVHLRISLSLLHSVQAHLERFVEDGQLKEFEIEQEKRPTHLGDINAWMRKTRKSR